MAKKKEDGLGLFKDAKSKADELIDLAMDMQLQEESVIIPPTTDIAKAIELTEGKEWQEFKEALIGKHTAKFNRIMESDSISDKDFVRYYLKTLEYVKPKIVREKVFEGDEEDNTININILSINGKTEEITTIDITKLDEDV